MTRKSRAIFLPNLYNNESKYLVGSRQSEITNYGLDLTYGKTRLIDDVNMPENYEEIMNANKRKREKKCGNKEYCGYGIFRKENGYIYEGWFRNNVMNGYGMYISPDGKIKTGEYKNFILKGIGQIYDEIELSLKWDLRSRGIDVSCFLGESVIEKSLDK